MKTNVYVVYDKVADEVVVMAMCKTDGLFLRQNMPYFTKINPNYMSDYTVLCIGQFCDSTMQVENLSTPRIVAWDSYGHPEEKGVVSPVTAKLEEGRPVSK